MKHSARNLRWDKEHESNDGGPALKKPDRSILQMITSPDLRQVVGSMLNTLQTAQERGVAQAQSRQAFVNAATQAGVTLQNLRRAHMVVNGTQTEQNWPSGDVQTADAGVSSTPSVATKGTSTEGPKTKNTGSGPDVVSTTDTGTDPFPPDGPKAKARGRRPRPQDDDEEMQPASDTDMDDDKGPPKPWPGPGGSRASAAVQTDPRDEPMRPYVSDHHPYMPGDHGPGASPAELIALQQQAARQAQYLAEVELSKKKMEQAMRELHNHNKRHEAAAMAANALAEANQSKYNSLLEQLSSHQQATAAANAQHQSVVTQLQAVEEVLKRTEAEHGAQIAELMDQIAAAHNATQSNAAKVMADAVEHGRQLGLGELQALRAQFARELAEARAAHDSERERYTRAMQEMVTKINSAIPVAMPSSARMEDVKGALKRARDAVDEHAVALAEAAANNPIMPRARVMQTRIGSLSYIPEDESVEVAANSGSGPPPPPGGGRSSVGRPSSVPPAARPPPSGAGPMPVAAPTGPTKRPASLSPDRLAEVVAQAMQDKAAKKEEQENDRVAVLRDTLIGMLRASTKGDTDTRGRTLTKGEPNLKSRSRTPAEPKGKAPSMSRKIITPPNSRSPSIGVA